MPLKEKNLSKKHSFYIFIFLLIFFPLFSKEILVKEIKSKYSHIKIIDFGSLRSLLFVRDSGEEVVESTLDINFPHQLFLLYTQKMYAGFLISNLPSKILLAGLGGGSMVHFTNYYFPQIQMDVVEIDPDVIKIAKTYFSLKEKSGTKIYNEDIYKFLKNTNLKYDLIFMDAFLKPSSTTDPTGVNLKQKEKDFFQDLKNHLNPKGVVVFNINTYDGFQKDILSMKENFSNIYIFRKGLSGNVIVVCSMEKERYTKDYMLNRALEIDNIYKPSFKFQNLVSMYDFEQKTLKY
jgi:spermidine synthase